MFLFGSLVSITLEPPSTPGFGVLVDCPKHLRLCQVQKSGVLLGQQCNQCLWYDKKDWKLEKKNRIATSETRRLEGGANPLIITGGRLMAPYRRTTLLSSTSTATTTKQQQQQQQQQQRNVRIQQGRSRECPPGRVISRENMGPREYSTISQIII